MRNRTPTKGIKAGDIVRPTPTALHELGGNIGFTTARVVAIKSHMVDGKPERSLVLVEYHALGTPAFARVREALHERWLETVPAMLDRSEVAHG